MALKTLNKTSRKTSLEILKLARRLGIETVDLANSYKSYKDIFNYFQLKQLENFNENINKKIRKKFN